jgi:hypothetical protein
MTASSDFKHLSSAIQLCLRRVNRYHVRLNTKRVVGRRGLEPRTSALSARRSAS